MPRRVSLVSLLSLLSALLIAACAPDADPPGTMSVVAPHALFGEGPAATCPTGGYFTTVYVDPTVTLSDGWHFTRITDAINSVRAGRVQRGEKTLADAACRITIEVAPGTYVGGFTASTTREIFPLVLDVPAVTLEGGLRMALVNDRATGAEAVGSQASVLQPTAALTATQALIIVTDQSTNLVAGSAGDTHGDGVTIRGLQFNSGFAAPDPNSAGAGWGIFAMRAQSLIIEENRFGFLLGTAVDGRAITGRVAHNTATDLGTGVCTICLSGPGSFDVTGNTIARSGLVGVYVLSATLSAVPPAVVAQSVTGAATMISTIDNNAISADQKHPVGTAIRVSAVGMTPGGVAPTLASIAGHQTTVTATNNDLTDNRFGIIGDAGFPPLNTLTNVPSGNITLTLGGNHFTNSCQADLYLAFARHTRGLGMTVPQAAQAGYLKNSTYTVTLNGNLAWDSVWYAHPTADNGVTLNNTLTVDGGPIDRGARSAYHGTECDFQPGGNAWIGLKNSDDVGTKFDLLTEIKRNGVLVATGQTSNVPGGSSGFNNAVERALSAATLKDVEAVRTGDVLSVTISARIAEGVAGHTSGTARLWYGDGTARSRMTTLVDTLSRTFYLTKDATGVLKLADTPGTGTRQFLDAAVNKNNGNPWKVFGTWSRTMP